MLIICLTLNRLLDLGLGFLVAKSKGVKERSIRLPGRFPFGYTGFQVISDFDHVIFTSSFRSREACDFDQTRVLVQVGLTKLRTSEELICKKNFIRFRSTWQNFSELIFPETRIYQFNTQSHFEWRYWTNLHPRVSFPILPEWSDFEQYFVQLSLARFHLPWLGSVSTQLTGVFRQLVIEMEKSPSRERYQTFFFLEWIIGSCNTLFLSYHLDPPLEVCMGTSFGFHLLLRTLLLEVLTRALSHNPLIAIPTTAQTLLRSRLVIRIDWCHFWLCRGAALSIATIQARPYDEIRRTISLSTN